MAGVKEVVDVATKTDAVLENVPAVAKSRPTIQKTLVHGARDPRVALGVGLLVGAGLGALITHKLLNKKLDAKHEAIAREEIEAAKEYYRENNPRVVRERKVYSPEELLAELHEEEHNGKAEQAVDNLIKLYQGAEEQAEVDAEESAGYLEQVEGRVIEQEIVTTVTDTEGTTTNVFSVNLTSDPIEGSGWDYEVEQKKREANPDKPYIISEEEFLEGESEYDQICLTYFEGDDILADDKDAPVPDPDTTVGEENLTRFGHGTKDKNVLFVRNDRLELEFEIARSSGKFQVEVLGFDDPDDELRHSYSRTPRRFRGHDD